jgi:hypothetical protein
LTLPQTLRLRFSFTAVRCLYDVLLTPWCRYECSIDVRELVSVEDVMVEMNLGPNGGLVYAMEYLVSNIDWLQVASTACKFGFVLVLKQSLCFYATVIRYLLGHAHDNHR